MDENDSENKDDNKMKGLVDRLRRLLQGLKLKRNTMCETLETEDIRTDLQLKWHAMMRFQMYSMFRL